MVEGVRSRFDVINDLLKQYPIESNSSWWLINYPDVYAGYDYAKGLFRPVVETVRTKARSGLRLFLIILGILAVLGVAVYFIFMYFLSAGLSSILG